MRKMVYTKKQGELLKLWKTGRLKRINLLQGSVRSGKTWISLVLWAFWVASCPRGPSYLMAAKSLTSLKHNCLELLADLVGEDNFHYSIAKKEGELFGRKIILEGVNDARSEGKIRGLTLMGAYCDELTLFDEDFFAMLLTRLSLPGARLFATTNPDSPGHWLMRDYISRKDKLDMLVVDFNIDSNPFLDKAYVENLKAEFSGVFYQRYILGRWVVAEGAVYREFSENKGDFIINEPPVADFSTVGVDFGGARSASAFVLTGFSAGFRQVTALDEWYHKGELSPAELNERFVEFVRRNAMFKPVAAYCDSAEQILLSGIRYAAQNHGLSISIQNAKKGPINERIRFFNAIMNKRAFNVLYTCPKLISALEEAVWEADSNEDRRLDNFTSNIDSLDALEYSAEAYFRHVMQAVYGTFN